MALSRRGLLALAGSGLAAGGLTALNNAKRSSTAPVTALTAPGPPTVARSAVRYVVVVLARGGLDPVYTLDPKRRDEVADEVDVPYETSEIIDQNGLRLGPHFARLAEYVPRLAVLRGVQVRTANHETGAMQMLRLRTAVTPGMPSILDIVGSYRDRQPLASVTLGDATQYEYSPGALGTPTYRSSHDILTAVDGLDPAQLALLAQSHDEQLRRQIHAPTQVIDSLRQARDLYRHLAHVPRFTVDTWSPYRNTQALGADFQRVLWLLQNNVSRGVYLRVHFAWDTHFHNARLQWDSTRKLVPMLARFFDELDSRHNEYGSLRDQTLVVMGSEIGRHPVLNRFDGKDHFPEAPYVLSGPPVRTGQAFGTTGPMMQALPIDLDTGRAHTVGHRVVLDDLGATVLRWAGVDPVVHGYYGQHLRFLERTA